MRKEEFIKKVEEFCLSCKTNYVSEEDAIYPSLIGMRLYDLPLIGFASSDDPLFTETFKKEEVIHPLYKAPKEWLSDSKTVISFFFPTSKQVKESNKKLLDEPYEEGIEMSCSAEWLLARCEGQLFINEVVTYAANLLNQDNYKTVIPSLSKDFKMLEPFKSNWSERHAAYAAGLGTFGLSKGLITKKGIAGRIGSLITNAYFEPTIREYNDPFEYCIRCGACQRRCPGKAIDLARGLALGKDHIKCVGHISNSTKKPFGVNKRVRYGCGKCQVAVPCSDGIPSKINK